MRMDYKGYLAVVPPEHQSAFAIGMITGIVDSVIEAPDKIQEIRAVLSALHETQRSVKRT